MCCRYYWLCVCLFIIHSLSVEWSCHPWRRNQPPWAAHTWIKSRIRWPINSERCSARGNWHPAAALGWSAGVVEPGWTSIAGTCAAFACLLISAVLFRVCRLCLFCIAWWLSLYYRYKATREAQLHAEEDQRRALLLQRELSDLTARKVNNQLLSAFVVSPDLCAVRKRLSCRKK